MRTLKFKSRLHIIAIFTAVNHNCNHKQRTLKQRNTQNGSKSTNHKSWPFEPIKVKLCFLRGLLRWLTAAKNAILSWLLNLRIRMFVKSAVKDKCNRLLSIKVGLAISLQLPSTYRHQFTHLTSWNKWTYNRTVLLLLHPSTIFFQLYLKVCVCMDQSYNQMTPLWDLSLFLTNLHNKTLQLACCITFFVSAP